MLMDSEPSKPADDLSRIEVRGLLNLQRKFLRHYFRLQAVEQRLSAKARRRDRSSGRVTILQVERERQRIGRELHTGVGQMLAAIRLQMEIISSHLDNPSESVIQALNRVNSLATEALDQVRSVSRRLHPPEWLRLDLGTAVRQLWDMSGMPEKYHGRIRIEPLPGDPDLEIKILIYRAFQEALANITRHSQATHVEAALEAENGTLMLRVTDNGVGFDAEKLVSAPANVASGLGLRTIREHAVSLGGKLVLESGPSGTTLVLTAPLRTAS
jgi:two-component system NarL family sensor kinase